MRRKLYRKKKRLLNCYVIFLMMVSLAFMIMALCNGLQEENKILNIISGGLLWTGGIGAIVIWICISTARRNEYIDNSKYTFTQKMGIIHFFKNKYAIAADSFMILSMIVLVAAKLWMNNAVLMLVSVSVFIFSFGLHCLFNGINYVYINSR